MGNGPLALCLHGFPDSAHTWRHLLPSLADASFRAVAPYMRGYSPTGLPTDGCYSLGAPAQDAVAIHDAVGADDGALFIGHDWGAGAAYVAAAFAPDNMVNAQITGPMMRDSRQATRDVRIQAMGARHGADGDPGPWCDQMVDWTSQHTDDWDNWHDDGD